MKYKVYYLCYHCKKPLSKYQVYYSDGVCPKCGTISDGTIVNHNKCARRIETPRNWWHKLLYGNWGE